MWFSFDVVVPNLTLGHCSGYNIVFSVKLLNLEYNYYLHAYIMQYTDKQATG